MGGPNSTILTQAHDAEDGEERGSDKRLAHRLVCCQRSGAPVLGGPMRVRFAWLQLCHSVANVCLVRLLASTKLQPLLTSAPSLRPTRTAGP
jgi:hypothetical protein